MSQTPDVIATLEAEAADLVFPHFSETTALALGRTLLDLAQDRALAVVIDIRTPDRTFFHAALPGSTPLNDRWALRKSNVVFAYQAASLLVGLRLKDKDRGVEADGLDPAHHAAHGGSVPVRSAGLVVAAVTVSGLAQTDYHALVIEAMRIVLG